MYLRKRLKIAASFLLAMTAGLRCRFSLQLILIIMLMGSAVAVEAGTLKLTAVEPTVLFSREAEGLQQVVNVTVENTGDSVPARLEVTLGDTTLTRDLGELKKGTHQLQVKVQDRRTPGPAAFVLKARGEIQDRSPMCRGSVGACPRSWPAPG